MRGVDEIVHSLYARRVKFYRFNPNWDLYNTFVRFDSNVSALILQTIFFIMLVLC